jgi:hypothetical protein
MVGAWEVKEHGERGMGAEHTIPVIELIHRLKKALDKVQFAQQLLHAQTAQQVLSMGLTPRFH